MPRPPVPDAKPGTLRMRRKRAGLVAVQIGGDVYEVTPEEAKRLRSAVEALVWARERKGEPARRPLAVND